MTMSIIRSKDELLYTDHGDAYIDLCMGYGSVWFGHNHESINAAICEQLSLHGSPGYLHTEIHSRAVHMLSRYIPESHYVVGLYSTGMEAIETALRIAVSHTKRTHIAGFKGSNHGNSALTSALGRAPSAIDINNLHRLPFLQEQSEESIINNLRSLAKQHPLGAIVVEPIQMSAGGCYATVDFYNALDSIAKENDALVIFDETLTGFYRSGECFYSSRLLSPPDIYVIGKGFANGFPASAVILHKEIQVDRNKIKIGSTFHNHPLAAAAIDASLRYLSTLDAHSDVQHMEKLIKTHLPTGHLTGMGAMWCLKTPDKMSSQEFAHQLLDKGIVVSYYEGYIRLLPPINIPHHSLIKACKYIADIYEDYNE